MGFALEGWTLLGVLLVVLMLGVLGGAALGYFTASTDLRWEKAKAWQEGADAMASAIRRVWQPPTTLIAKVRNPYERPLAPEPPHVVIPTPGWTSPPEQRYDFELFDQDAPTAAAVAIELRGDD